MNEDVIGTASFGLDVEPILPDGWEEGMDIFADSAEDADDPIADGQEDDLLEALTNETGAADPDAPTTGKNGDADVPSAGEETDAQPDGADAEPETPSRILKLKINHGDREVDVAKMSDDDLIALLQKGYAFDDLRDRENRKLYRSVYQEQIDAGMTEALAKLVAKDAAGKSYSLTDEEDAPDTPADPGPASESAAAPARDFRQEVEQLKALYPEFREVPDEVAKAVAKGAPLLVAYVAYRERESAKTAATLKQENQVLKQNAASAAKAPVRGVTGGGDVAAAPKKNLFESGFDAGMNWR